MPSFDQTPDKPKSFGYKILWFAVRASDPASVLDALQLGPGVQANWASGVSAAYDYEVEWVFASPPVDGWVFVVGGSLGQPVALSAPQLGGPYDIGRRFDVLFSRLMKKFDDVQYFGSHRTVDLAAWARALKGKPIRIFAVASSGSDDHVYANFGDQTPEEAKLKFANLTGLSPSDAGERIFKIEREQEAEKRALVAKGLSAREAGARVLQKGRYAFPREQDVFDLAALWSVDPTQLSNQDHPLGLGLAARLPKNI